MICRRSSRHCPGQGSRTQFASERFVPAARECSTPRTIGVLISGRGSNLQALIDAIASGSLPARIGIVISNRAQAAGLQRAERAGIETLVLNHRDFPDRASFDTAVASELRSRGVEIV